MQELKIEYVPIDSIKPYKRNAKLHPQEQIEQIKASMVEFGNIDPIGIWHNEIVEGHGRHIAAKELGYDTVPVIRLDELTEEQRRAYALVHNKLTMNSEFDFDLLDFELGNIDIDMEQFGFELDDDYDEDGESGGFDKEPNKKWFTEDEIKQAVVDGWQTYESARQFCDNAIDEASAMWQFNRLCQGYRDGYHISELFNPHRLATDTIKHKSILENWNNNPEYRKQFARYIVEVAERVPPRCEYYKLTSAGVAGVQYVNEFQPYLARDIYKQYCKDGDRILNPCAGWGGRLLGIASCMFEDIEYWETDPQQDTYAGLVKLKEFLKLGDNYKQFNLPFEDLELEDDYFDFVFTSPPYFDTERYGTDDTQSYKRYDSYDYWCESFLKPMLDKILRVMKEDGSCILNVGNVRYDIDKQIIEHLRTRGIACKRIKDFKIGGDGIGDRTGEDGEPFILFHKR